ncbi:MAG: hypothetical protein MUQ10_13455 [Anaerolineae bacterium]|nr:hypothetical protein [Anaerolineae bacterium]
MVEPAEFAERQRVALEAGEVDEALRLLSELEAWIEAVSAWSWLRSNEPEGYEQLIDKLEQSLAGRSASGLTEMKQLIGILRSCEAHGISLVELDVPSHLHEYREAAPKLNTPVTGESQSRERLDVAIGTIKSHSCRADTRAWARTPRGQWRPEA